MIKKSETRETLKERVKDWMKVSSVYKYKDAFDMLVLETFFFIYYGLEQGYKIQELGNELGVFPLP